jgi:hypothetical protein
MMKQKIVGLEECNTMLASRLRKQKGVLALLLPYLIFAIGAEFLHNHGNERRASAPAYIATRAANLSSSHFISEHSDNCPACTWAGNNLSGPQVASDVEKISAVSTLVATCRVLYRAGNLRPATSRGPPLS